MSNQQPRNVRRTLLQLFRKLRRERDILRKAVREQHVLIARQHFVILEQRKALDEMNKAAEELKAASVRSGLMRIGVAMPCDENGPVQ